jgi:hypothetical protein
MNDKAANFPDVAEIVELLREKQNMDDNIINVLSNELVDETEVKLRLAELKIKLRATFSLSMVRMHNAREIDIYQIVNSDHLRAAIDQIGIDDKNSIEIHMSSGSSKLESARLCLESGDLESALIVVSSFIESEINMVIRIALRLQNFSHGTISASLKGTDLKTKINVILPLLQVKMSERQRQIALNQNSVRNNILHFKAVPMLDHVNGQSESDYDKVKNQAKAFFDEHPLDIIDHCFLSFVDCIVNEQPHFQHAFELFERFGIYDE